MGPFRPSFGGIAPVLLRSWLLVSFLTLQALAFGQTPPAPLKFVNPWVSAAQPSVPSDPLEIAGNAEPVQDIAQRATAINLLNNAQFLSNVRRGHYDLKTHFTSSDGTWQIEDSSPARNIYRWTVQGPSYSAVNLFLNRVIYSSQPPTAIPLRLAQAHSAIFAHFPMYGPRATLRMAAASLNGVAVTCVLTSHIFNAKPVSGPRRWEEYESCIDPKTGLLMSYSPAPGMYVSYDYSSAKQLNGVIFPGKFTITEAGQPVVEAQVDSLTGDVNAEAPIYTPAGLNPLGVGFPLTPPWRMQTMFFDGPPNSTPSNAQFVVVRGMVSPDGHFTDAEVLASSNPALNQRAVERATQPQFHMAADDGQEGATPQSHEAFLTTLFLTN
jgi:hypothetical protein